MKAKYKNKQGEVIEREFATPNDFCKFVIENEVIVMDDMEEPKLKIIALSKTEDDATGYGMFASELQGGMMYERKAMPNGFMESDKNNPTDIVFNIMTERGEKGWDELYKGKSGFLLNPFIIAYYALDYDVIHALDGWPYGVWAVMANMLLFFRKKVVITMQGTYAVEAFDRYWPAKLLKWAYNKADGLVAISRYTREQVLKEMPDLKIKVINHAPSSNLKQYA